MTEAYKKYISEFIGTFALVFIGAGSVATNYISDGALGLFGIATAFGLVVMAMIYATGHISGTHINPAVTIALVATKKMGGKDAVPYIISQLAGAVVAGMMLRIIYPTAVEAVNLGTTGLGAGVSFGTGVLVEAILTFLLVFTIFGAAVDSRAAPGFAGFAIGMVVLFDILVGGPLTGASMNPARTFGPALASGYWVNHLVYWIGPIIGGVLAGLVYEGVFAKDKSDE
ncbi:MAG: aquaporin [Candidatus Methanoperedens sp.]|jgi:MIP family channel proteins|nr:aquaporin [Candidatus Methanoperedens sp.]PKL53777.1 MAG: aquaporin [Candidatus Methanoperedenaceae archaeon HGW-Methanoperedenaceae-1]